MNLRALLLVAAISAGPCHIAFASQFGEIVAFGDSLTDAGNVSLSTFGTLPGAGYATRSLLGVPFPVGYYTNPQSGLGPAGLWIDQLAGKLGVTDPSPFLAPLGGTNYAIGSSFTAGFNGAAPGMDTQVSLFLASVLGSAPSDALYTFWGGANDIFNGLDPVAAADHIESEIEAVAADGGKTFLWLNLPFLGETPDLLAQGPPFTTLANLYSSEFNSEWASDLNTLDSMGINVTGVNVNSLFNNLIANPASYGFTNITDACNTTAGCDPNTFLYWDGEHPTTYADSLVANLAYQDLTATPEPPSIALLALGAFFCLGMAYVRAKRFERFPN